MARVLYVVPDGQDLGGIITSSENLMLGFKEAGHKATFAFLKHSHGAHSLAPRGKHADDFVIGAGTGLPMHPINGWRGVCYSSARPDEFIALANCHDVVVWGALYGLRNSYTEGTKDWLRCITDHNAANVFMVRDDHLEGRIPWALSFAPYAAGWAGVQQCSYDSLVGLGKPRALIFSGHGPALLETVHGKRKTQALAIATWKPWKRGRLLMQTAPLLKTMKLVVAGDGIEFRYMRSPEKARDKDFNPDGTRIWDQALKAGVSYLGAIPEHERDTLLTHSKFLVDFSYRVNSGQINRVIIEAMRHGAVPIADHNFIGTELFVPDEHYLPIHTPSGPAALAKALDRYAKFDLEEIRERNYARVDLFSRRNAADQLVKLGLGKKAGFKYDKGKPDPAKLARGVAAFKEIFG